MTVFIALIIIAAALAAVNFLKTPEISPEDIKDFKVEYRVYGGMEGEDIDIMLEPSPDGQALLTVHETLFNGAEETNETLVVPYEALGRIKAVYAERKVPLWGELGDSEFVALDAPTICVTFVADGKETVLSSDEEFPESGTGILYEIRSILYEYRE
ncbi:MAG: hypothetical protein IJG50_02090 [Clostridia bacterium]|nr:hypothetical protein [Clostridia bacterium]